MAKNITEVIDFIKNPDNLMSFGKSFATLNGQPLDKDSIFKSLAEAEAFAKTPSAHVGKILVVVEDGLVTAYVIDVDSTLKPIGDKETMDKLQEALNALTKRVEALEAKPAAGITADDIKAWNAEKGAHALAKTKADNTEFQTVKSAVNDAQTGLATKAQKSELTALKNVVEDTSTGLATKASQTDFTALKNKVDNETTGLDSKASQTALNGVSGRVKTLEDADLITRTGTAETDIDNIQSAYLKSISFDAASNKFTFVKQDNQQVIVDLDLASVIKSFAYDSSTEELILRDGEWKDSMTPEEKAKHEVRVKISALIDIYTGVDGAEIKVSVSEDNKISAELKAGSIASSKLAKAVTDDIAKGVAAKTAIDNPTTGLAKAHEKADANAQEIQTIKGKPAYNITSAQVSNWDAEVGAKELAGTKANQTDFESLSNKVNDVSTGLDSKASKTDLGTLEGRVDAHDTTLEGLRTDVDTKQTAAEVNALIQSATIKQAKVEGLTASLEGKVDKVKDSRLMTNTEGTQLADLVKLKPAEAGAQVNKIESVKTGDQTLAISNKTITIPAAMANSLGLVKGNAVENGVDVNNGLMSVHSLNVNKLVQTDGEELVLNGGTASGYNK